MIKEASTTDYQRLLSTTKGIRAVGRWLARSGALHQFSLASEQLREIDTVIAEAAAGIPQK